MRWVLLLLSAATSSAFVLINYSPVPSCRHNSRTRQLCVRMSGFSTGFGKPSSKKASGKTVGINKDGGKTKKGGQSTTTPDIKTGLQKQVAAIDVKRVLDEIDDTQDPFWQLIEPLILSEFPANDVQRVRGFIHHATGRKGLTTDIIQDKWRPHEDIHAFMEGIPATHFQDTSAFPFVAELERRYDEIKAEFEALLEHDKDRFQSVTSMNYDSGWRTLVLYFNGHRIPDFPYERCPVTCSILDTIPVAGRIAGFNRQASIRCAHLSINRQ